MMNEYEVVEMWNYHTDKYQRTLIVRTFDAGRACITILRRL